MELIRGLLNVRERQRGCVVTIGTYDGIHLGHQALLERLEMHAARLSAPAVLLTFEPMPREDLSPEVPPARLTSLRERCRVLQRMQLDNMLVLRFGEGLRFRRQPCRCIDVARWRREALPAKAGDEMVECRTGNA